MTVSTRARELAVAAAEAAADKLADDILAFDVGDQLVITDVFVLCSASNDRQVRAVVDGIEERLRGLGAKPVRREGEREGRWILLDYVDIIVHVQHAEERVYYSLERVWKDCPLQRSPRTAAGPTWTAAGSRGPPSRSSTGRRVVLWRHGQTAWNLAERFQGSSDVELDEIGIVQADRAARLLTTLAPAAIVSSDLRRASTTASALASLCGLEVRLDARLRETYGGSWQGRTSTSSRRGPRRLFRLAGRRRRPGRRRRTSYRGGRPGGAGVSDALADVPAEGTLVVVTHGGSARAAIGTMLDLPLDRWAVVGGLANCSWSVLEEAAAGRLAAGRAQRRQPSRAVSVTRSDPAGRRADEVESDVVVAGAGRFVPREATR